MPASVGSAAGRPAEVSYVTRATATFQTPALEREFAEFEFLRGVPFVQSLAVPAVGAGLWLVVVPLSPVVSVLAGCFAVAGLVNFACTTVGALRESVFRRHPRLLVGSLLGAGAVWISILFAQQFLYPDLDPEDDRELAFDGIRGWAMAFFAVMSSVVVYIPYLTFLQILAMELAVFVTIVASIGLTNQFELSFATRAGNAWGWFALILLLYTGLLYNQQVDRRHRFLLVRRLKQENIDISLRAKASPGVAGFMERFLRAGAAVGPTASRMPWEVDRADVEMGEVIGVGGYGTVYRATWRGGRVAVKELHLRGDDFVKSFMGEIALLAELRHPNIVLFMGVSCSPDSVLLVTELLERGSLAALIHEERALFTIADATSIAVQAARGLVYLHSVPVLHLDLKSANILLDQRLNCKVADFGMSKVRSVDDVAGDGDEVGLATLLNAAPEILDGQTPTSAADVYSFALVLWELGTSELPFQAELDSLDTSPFGLVPHILAGLRPKSPKIKAHPFFSIIDDAWQSVPDARPSIESVAASLARIEAEMSSGANVSLAVLPGGNAPASAAPRGPQVVLVFTDVEASTRLWESCPDEMHQALTMHNALLRSLLAEAGGYEVSTEGDAFFVAFEDAVHAVDWMLKAQEELLALDWPAGIVDAMADRASMGLYRGLRVRMGVHMGEPIVELDACTRRINYLGPPVNKAARIAGLASGGEIVMSDAVYRLVQGKAKVHAASLGEVELRGFEAPARLWAVYPPQLARRGTHRLAQPKGSDRDSESPPTARVNLPLQLSPTEIETGAVIGTGSFGQVCKGVLRGETVAVKRLLRSAVDEKTLLNLLHEGAVMRQLDHPNIVRLVGICTAPANVCLVLEYVPMVLHDLLPHLRPEEQLACLCDVAAGVAYLHSHDIVHRDLKPANVLCGTSPFVAKLCDFGLARIKAVNRTMTRCGTPRFASPEVLQGGRYTESADVYSFGMVAYATMARRAPFSALAPMQAARRVAVGMRPPLGPQIPPWCCDIIKRCWVAQPEARPAMADVVEELRHRQTT